MEGLRHDYLFGIAVDSSNPDVVIVSSSNGPSRSYVAENAETFVYRKDGDGNEWKAVTDGLPKPRGSTIMSFASNVEAPGEFYAVNVYFSQPIQVVHGSNLISYGRETILNKRHWPLQLMIGSYLVQDVYVAIFSFVGLEKYI
jgi:hypothetical protein